MKHFLAGLTLLLCIHTYGQGDYKLKINDAIVDVSLDTEYEVLINGKKTKVSLRANDTLTYKDRLYSFQHFKDFKISKVVVEKGVEQIVLLTATGSGFLVQQYSSINPTQLNDIMLREVTKESLNYGYQMKRADYQRTLKSGQQVMVTKAILTYKDETNVYEIMTVGKKDEGLLVVTILMDKTLSNTAKGLIDLLWSSLEYN
jgi:hypothetical protein